jgi:putative zinc finger/helix-turn-helix YgiT family protein
MTRNAKRDAKAGEPGPASGPRPAERKYPARCTECGAREVRPAVVRHTGQKAHDGRLHALVIPDLHVLRCGKCGELLFDSESDRQITAALRRHLGLLRPEEIRTHLDALSLNQKDFAARLGVAAETVSRWLTGALIQSRAMDNLMRLFFDVPAAREYLARDSQAVGPVPDTNEKPGAPHAA